MRSDSTNRRALSTAATIGLLVGAALLVVLGFVLGRGSGAPDGTAGPATPEAVQQAAAPSPTALPQKPNPSRPVPSPEKAARRPARTPVPDPAAVVSRPDENAAPPPVAFDPPTLDFGNVSPGTELQSDVTITNTSGAAVQILSMKPDCKCTTVQDLAGTSIAAGDSLTFTAVLDKRSTPGFRSSNIRFVFAGYGVTSYELRSTVTYAVQAQPSFLNAMDTIAGRFTVTALDGRPFQVLTVNGEMPVFIDSHDPAVDPARTSYQLEWDLSRYDPDTCVDADGNRMPTFLVVETDHPEAPIVDLRVRHMPCSLPEPLNGRTWALTEMRGMVGIIPAGGSGELSTSLKWLTEAGPNDTIQRITVESGEFDAVLLPIEREGDTITCHVRITPKEGVRGLLAGAVRFHGFRPGHSALLHVYGRVVDGTDA